MGKMQDWPGKIQQKNESYATKRKKGKKGTGKGKSSIGMLSGCENRLLHGPSAQLHDAVWMKTGVPLGTGGGPGSRRKSKDAVLGPQLSICAPFVLERRPFTLSGHRRSQLGEGPAGGGKARAPFSF